MSETDDRPSFQEAETHGSTGCGEWGSDGMGNPEFRVNLEACPPDAWHLVGSPGLTALAHVSGTITLYATAGGMVRLADHGFVCESEGVPLVVDSVTFGTDRCTWSLHSGDARVLRTLIADPDAPVLRLEWTIEGSSNNPATPMIEEHFAIEAYPLVAAPLMSRRTPVPSTHRGFDRMVWKAMFTGSDAARRLSDRVRTHLGDRHPLRATIDRHERTIEWKPDRPRLRPTRPRLAMTVPPSVALRLGPIPPGSDADLDATRLTLRGGDTNAHFSASIEFLDPPGEPSDTAPGSTASRVLEGLPEPLDAEAQWHVYQLRGLRVPDPYIGHEFVMQGSAYGFVHGLHGAVRDEAFVVVALAPIDPGVARGTLLSMTSMSRSDGTFAYAHTGFGAAVSGGIHAAPSDLGLFYLWALSVYVAATGDRDVMTQRVRLRGTPNAQRSVGEVAVAAARALDAKVGLGPHGMLRVGSGDWADPISLMVRRRRAFHRYGESTFNTAMALAILPGALDLLDELDSGAARRCRDLVEFLGATLEGAWTGRWYLRGWDGRGQPIGRDHLFLDAQVWALIAGHGPLERRRELVETMGRLLDDPSPIGPTILDRPHRVRLGMLADGWDCNGGVWAALGGLTAWAFAVHDPRRAWRTLHKQSFANRRAAYPNVWYGQWSGPDAANAYFGDRPGETFVQPATPMTEFPVMNSNVHAGALIGMIETLGAIRASTGVGTPSE